MTVLRQVVEALANIIALGLDDVAASVKVDHTPPGILEDRSANMWTVTVCFYGNLLSLTWEEYCAFSSERLDSERKRIDQLFIPCKLHYLIDTISDLLSTMTNIIARLIHDERPANH